MTRGLFVTAIGTDCGKTHVSCALLRELAFSGRAPLALKPLMSGFGPEALEASDAGRLLAACGKPVSAESVGAICWASFAPALAPNVAARVAGANLDDRKLLAFARDRISAARGPFLVEGAGGVMSPLTDSCTNLDLMAGLSLPVLLVATSYLGAVSHTLTALDVLARKNLKVAGIVVSEPSSQASPAEDFAEELARWTPAVIATAPFTTQPEARQPWAPALAARLFD